MNGCCATRPIAAVMAYIGRSGWNNLSIGNAIPDDEILEAVDASYAMVVSKLPKKDRPAPAGAGEPTGPGRPASVTAAEDPVRSTPTRLLLRRAGALSRMAAARWITARSYAGDRVQPGDRRVIEGRSEPGSTPPPHPHPEHDERAQEHHDADDQQEEATP